MRFWLDRDDDALREGEGWSRLQQTNRMRRLQISVLPFVSAMNAILGPSVEWCVSLWEA